MSQSIAECLREFATFDRLSDDDLTVLAGRARYRELPKRSVLFRDGDDDPWIFCLTEGTLELVSTDGRQRHIEAGTHAAGYPVSALRPRQYTATALTPVRVISIDGNEIGNWHEVLMNSDFEVEEIEEFEGFEVREEVDEDCERILASDLEMPSLPTVALEAQRVIDRDESGVEVLARLVLNDPSITAKLVKAANSPLFYGRGNIETCERAIVRLGLNTTRQLVIAFAMRDLFTCEAPHMHARMQALWQHSAEVAAISYVLARHLEFNDPAEAQLAGLVHDIGGVPVLSYASSMPQFANNPEAISELDNRLRPMLGPQLLRSWNFSEPIVDAARNAEHWQRTGPEKPDLVDIVITAHLVSHLGKAQALQMPPLKEVCAFNKLFGDDIEPEQIVDLLAQAQNEVDELRSLLCN
jgi:HD-like signal output (HDOD) protein